MHSTMRSPTSRLWMQTPTGGSFADLDPAHLSKRALAETCAKVRYLHESHASYRSGKLSHSRYLWSSHRRAPSHQAKADYRRATPAERMRFALQHLAVTVGQDEVHHIRHAMTGLRVTMLPLLPLIGDGFSMKLWHH